MDEFHYLYPVHPALRYAWFAKYLLYGFGGLHLFFSLWMLLEYFTVNWFNFGLPRIVYTNKLVSLIRRYCTYVAKIMMIMQCSVRPTLIYLKSYEHC